MLPLLQVQADSTRFLGFLRITREELLGKLLAVAVIWLLAWLGY